MGEPGAESLGSLAARMGLAKSSLSVHRSRCLGLAVTTFRHLPPAVASSERVTEQSERRSEQGFAATPSEPTPHAKPLAHQLPGPRSPSVEEEQSVTAQHIRAIANRIAVGAWSNRKDVVGLAKVWGVPEGEVRRLHALAALRVKADRGTYAAQRELSVARVTEIIEEERADAKKYKAAAEEAFLQAARAPRGQMSSAPATLAQRLAGLARDTQLHAEKHLASITFQRPREPHQVLNVTFSAHPDWGAAAERMRVILETAELLGRSTGLVAFVHEGLSAWEQGGDAALDEWRREQIEASSMLLTQGEDGSYVATGSEAVA